MPMMDAFWGDRIASQINAVMSDHDDRTLINLASGEYFKAVKTKKLGARIVQCQFHDWKDDRRTPNVISFAAKYARGLMARYLIEQRIDRAEGLKDFTVDRYAFQPDQSSEDTWVFGRKFVPVTL